MNDDDVRHDAPTRRDTLKYGAAAAASIGLAGCSEVAEQAGGGTPTGTGTGSYTVNMAPMGDVGFDGVPETAAIYDSVWADHLVALGQQDRIVSLGFPDRYFTGYYEQLPGVAFDTSDLTSMFNEGLPKELFYELDADVHHIDPCRWLSFDSGWSRGEFDDIEEQVGPFFANRFSRAHADPPEGECRDAYQFYSVWELAEKISQVYQVQNRGEQLRSVREEMVSKIQDRLPPASERPTVALVIYNADDETFGTYEINGPGFAKAHYRPLEPVGAFAGSDETYANNYSAIDLEQMLEVDPDVIIHHWDIEPSDRFEALLALEDDPVGKKLTAIQNDRVYVGGTPMQGPIFNLFQLETAAQQIYPGEFGAFQGVGEMPEENMLFDRQRVADIINGDS
ncbi:ABC transporter substrate-binding protein [Haloarcula salinisoli]|uniref:ABC transporter substrate-binding protein n=1 Tax=Haloarcula salinisoli TaxID=2487746 RepID=A0A8J7YLS4_9EURY|nr:ABC transporter substrate-binding protein [Halomicroarcula salinisoli]MBX0305119.1 ABC transporter substrate-binding protein [Halomicroarcula salinisoli]